VAAAAGDDYAFDRGFASQTGFGFAAVDAVLELEEARFAVGVDVVGNGGTAFGDGFAQDLFYGGKEFGELVAGDGGGAAARANSGTE